MSRWDSHRILLCAALAAAGCKKKDERVEEVPPPRNVASLDLVNTEIGNGLAVRADGAPTSISWERVIVLDDDRAVLLGHAHDDAWALVTADRGRTWRGMNAPSKGWSGWGVSGSGSIVFATGERERPKTPGAKAPAKSPAEKPQPIVSAALWLAAPNDTRLNGPRIFFPDGGKLKVARIDSGIAAPALLDGGVVSLIGDRDKALAALFLTDQGATDSIALDAKAAPGKKPSLVPVPYGRPPKLLGVNGANLEIYAWPKPGEKLGAAAVLPGFRAESTAFEQLAEGPSCEWEAFAFRRLTGSQPWAIGVGGDHALALKLPPSQASWLGCSGDALVVETQAVDPGDPEKKRKVPQLVRCTFDGHCADPKAPPYAIWSEKHDRQIWAVPSARGLVAVMRAQAGSRWGMYLGQSNDGGKSFELPRTIGEGREDRGYLEFGALIRFPQRLVMLISADVGATGRRGWYALASDDDGDNWGPP